MEYSRDSVIFVQRTQRKVACFSVVSSVIFLSLFVSLNQNRQERACSTFRSTYLRFLHPRQAWGLKSHKSRLCIQPHHESSQ